MSKLTQAEIEQKLDQLMVPPINDEALFGYLRTLSLEDQMYATQYGIARADEGMQLGLQKYLRGLIP